MSRVQNTSFDSFKTGELGFENAKQLWIPTPVSGVVLYCTVQNRDQVPTSYKHEPDGVREQREDRAYFEPGVKSKDIAAVGSKDR